MNNFRMSTLMGILLASLSALNAMERVDGPERLRAASWNVAVDFFDGKDKTEDQRHTWPVRRNAVFRTLEQVDPDVVGLQELSPGQAVEFGQLEPYKSLFLSSTPSEVPTGAIVGREEVGEWIGKFVGTALTGLLWRPDRLELQDCGRFWLNERPDELPTLTDRGETDKGFGNMNTYRAVLYATLKHLATGREVCVFNSHYPLKFGEDGSRMRRRCAQAEIEKIADVIGGDPATSEKLCISMGDRNTVPVVKGGETDVASMDPLLAVLRNCRDARRVFGPASTFAGFSFDTFVNPIEDGQFTDPGVVDLMAANRQAEQAAHVYSQFDPSTGEVTLNPAVVHPGRYGASDHMAVVADY